MVVPRGYLLIKWLLVGIVTGCLTLTWHLHRAAQTTVGPVRSLATGTVALTRLLQVTATGADHAARGAALTPLPDGRLYLWWWEKRALDAPQVPTPIEMKVARWTGAAFGPASPVPLKQRGWQQTLRLQSLPDASAVISSVSMTPDILSGTRGDWDVRYSRLQAVNTPDPTTAAFVMNSHPAAMLCTAKDAAAHASSHTPYKSVGWMPYRPKGTETEDDYLYPDFIISRTKSTWYATGTGRWQNIWFTKSDNQGKTWQVRQTFGKGWESGLSYTGHGNHTVTHFTSPVRSWQPTLCDAGRGNLLIFAVTKQGIGKGTGDPFWPDDQPRRSEGPCWPPYGGIEARLSHDDGKTWSAPQAVPSSPFTLQCRACVAPDGRIWLVSVQTVDRFEPRTALSLTSSCNGGRTWDTPIRLTDGTHFDREPDLAFYGGKLRIAFTRGDRGGHTDIWLADVDLEARSNIGVEVAAKPVAPYAGSAIVRSLQPEPHETPGIMSGALDNPDHTMVLYARVKPPVAGVTVHFDVHDASPSTIAASLSRREALTDADGIAQTVVKSSNTDTPHFKALVTARVKEGDTRRAKSFAVEILLPDITFGPPPLH